MSTYDNLDAIYDHLLDCEMFTEAELGIALRLAGNNPDTYDTLMMHRFGCSIDVCECGAVYVPQDSAGDGVCQDCYDRSELADADDWDAVDFLVDVDELAVLALAA